jgi:hypothetical protein
MTEFRKRPPSRRSISVKATRSLKLRFHQKRPLMPVENPLTGASMAATQSTWSLKLGAVGPMLGACRDASVRRVGGVV